MARVQGRGSAPGARTSPRPPGSPSPSPSRATAGVDVTSLLLALADRHAAADPALALRCLDAAAQMGGELPAPASRQREELAAGLRG